jgi:hypothetical protein
MTTTTFRPMSLRCRLGMHAWEDVACPDGQYLRKCTRCHDEQGPFAQYERQPAPRDGLRNYLSG